MKTSIVWFTNNLRINDNKPLHAAVRKGNAIIPVYVFDPNCLKETQYKTKKIGEYRLNFLVESLIQLNQTLQEFGTGLLVKYGSTAQVMSELVQQYNVSEVDAVESPACEERKIQEEVERIIWKQNCVLNVYDTNTLFDTKELPFSLKQLPDVFTKFRTIIEKECVVKSPMVFSDVIHSPKLPSFEIPEVIFNQIKNSKIDNRTAFPFQGGLIEAQKHLQSYVFEKQNITSYKETRNQMIGPDFSTKFSPWLAFGCISPREIMHTIHQFENEILKNDSTYWVYFELLWREYFHWLMRKYDNLFFTKNGIKKSEPMDRKYDERIFETWKTGQTGNQFIDANMHELNQTGFMSNRGRQIVASYLCNDLKIDWRFGAAYFEEKLIDYDVCSNWGNWAYIAGVGNDPKGHRVFNCEKQANEYDKMNKYRELWKRH